MRPTAITTDEAPTLLRRAYRFRLEPVAEVNRLLFGFGDARRFAFNACVAVLEEANLVARSAGGRYASARFFGYENLWAAVLVPLLDHEPWLRHAPVQVLQQAVMDFAQAYRNFLSGVTKRPPGFLRVATAVPTLRYPQHVKMNGQAFQLPKLGWVKYRQSYRKMPKGEMGGVTLKFEHGHWWVVALFSAAVPDIKQTPASALGLDYGVKNTLATSARQVLSAPVATEGERRRIHWLERRVTKKKVGSVRRAREQARLNKFRLKITRRLQDWRHKTTTTLAKNHGLIAVEDLALVNMTASAKGTVEAPGERVAQKSGLNRALLEPGFGLICAQLAYKQAARGQAFIAVPPQGTSQHCLRCEHTAAENRPTRDRFACVRCGFEDEADFVAANNVIRRGKLIFGGRTGRDCALKTTSSGSTGTRKRDTSRGSAVRRDRGIPAKTAHAV